MTNVRVCVVGQHTQIVSAHSDCIVFHALQMRNGNCALLSKISFTPRLHNTTEFSVRCMNAHTWQEGSLQSGAFLLA